MDRPWHHPTPRPSPSCRRHACGMGEGEYRPGLGVWWHSMTQDRQRPPAVDPICGPADFAAAFDVSRETIARLITYEGLLRQWQKAVNLVAPGTLDAVWHRHFA